MFICIHGGVFLWLSTGRGITGVMIPGCPETYQQSQEGEKSFRQFRDQHQKIRTFQQGDIIALPAGVAHWCYNDGDSDLVTVAVEDTGNNQNQLDNQPRVRYLPNNYTRAYGLRQPHPIPKNEIYEPYLFYAYYNLTVHLIG